MRLVRLGWAGVAWVVGLVTHTWMGRSPMSKGKVDSRKGSNSAIAARPCGYTVAKDISKHRMTVI